MHECEEFSLNTIHPLMVLNTSRFCEHSERTMGISNFYSFRGRSDMDTEITLLPDQCSSFIFSYKGKTCRCFTAECTARRKTFTAEKNTVYFIVRFLPGENPWLEKKVSEDSDRKNIPEKLNHLFPLIKKVSEKNTFEERISSFISEYGKFCETKVTAGQLLFRELIKIIFSRKGMLRISELEKLSGYSARYINHIFETQTGMSAKQFCSTVKMQYVLKKLNEEDIHFLSGISRDFGFYDQAHFIHEFKDFTGMTPGEYMSLIKEAGIKTA